MYNPDDIVKSIQYSARKYAGTNNQLKSKNNSWDGYYKNLYKEDNQIDEKRSVLDRTFDLLSVGQYTTMGVIKGVMNNIKGNDGPGIAEGFVGGLKAANPFGEGYAKGEHSFSHVLRQAGWKPTTTAGRIAKMTVGFVGDVFLDPTTYLSGGLKPLLKGSGEAGLKMFKAAKVSNKLGELEKLGYKVTDKYLDEIPIQEYEKVKKQLSSTNSLLNADEIEHAAQSAASKMKKELDNSHLFDMTDAEEYSRKIAGEIEQKTGIKASEEQILDDARKFYDKYNQLAGKSEDRGISLSLANAPFGKKIFKGLADKSFTITTPEAYKAIGDATFAPALNKVRDAFYGTKLANMLSTNTILYKFGKENPEQLFKQMKFIDMIKSQNLDKVEQERAIRDMARQFDMTPSQQKEIIRIIEDRKIGSRIQAMVKFANTQEAEQIRTDMQDARIAKQAELDDLMKQYDANRVEFDVAQKNSESRIAKLDEKKQELLNIEEQLKTKQTTDSDYQELINKRDLLSKDIEQSTSEIADIGNKIGNIQEKLDSVRQSKLEKLSSVLNDKNSSIQELNKAKESLMKLYGTNKSTNVEDAVTYELSEPKKILDIAERWANVDKFRKSKELNNEQILNIKEQVVADLNHYLFNGAEIISPNIIDKNISDIVKELSTEIKEGRFSNSNDYFSKFKSELITKILSSPERFTEKGQEIFNFVRKNFTNKNSTHFNSSGSFGSSGNKNFNEFYYERRALAKKVIDEYQKHIDSGIKTKDTDFIKLKFPNLSQDLFKNKNKKDITLEDVYGVLSQTQKFVEDESELVSYFFSNPEAYQRAISDVTKAERNANMERVMSELELNKDNVDRANFISDQNIESRQRGDKLTTDIENMMYAQKSQPRPLSKAQIINGLIDELFGKSNLKLSDKLSSMSEDQTLIIKEAFARLQKEIEMNFYDKTLSDLTEKQQAWFLKGVSSDIRSLFGINNSFRKQNTNNSFTFKGDIVIDERKKKKDFSYATTNLEHTDEKNALNKNYFQTLVASYNKSLINKDIENKISQLSNSQNIGIIGTRGDSNGVNISRELELIKAIASKIKEQGKFVVTGGAPGTDNAALAGAMERTKLFSPWPGHEKGIPYHNGFVPQADLIPNDSFNFINKPVIYDEKIHKDWTESVLKHHQNPESLSQGAFKLMARNFGIAKESDIIIALPNLAKQHGGGTGQAIKIAESLGKSVIDLTNINELESIVKHYGLQDEFSDVIEKIKKQNKNYNESIDVLRQKDSNGEYVFENKTKTEIKNTSDSKDINIEEPNQQELKPFQYKVDSGDTVIYRTTRSFNSNKPSFVPSENRADKGVYGEIVEAIDKDGNLNYLVKSPSGSVEEIPAENILSTVKQTDRATSNFVYTQKDLIKREIPIPREEIDARIAEIDTAIEMANRAYDDAVKQITDKRIGGEGKLQSQLDKLQALHKAELDKLSGYKENLSAIDEKIQIPNPQNEASKMFNNQMNGSRVQRIQDDIARREEAHKKQMEFIQNNRDTEFDISNKIDNLTKEIEDLDTKLTNDSIFEEYVKTNFGDNFIQRAIDNLATSDKVLDKILNDELGLDDKVKESVKLLKKNLYDIGLSEVEIDKLGRGQFDEMWSTYITHIATDDFIKYQDAIKADPNVVVSNDLGFGTKGYNPHNKERQITKLKINDEWVENPNIMQINEYFRDALKGKNAFSENVADIYLYRALKNLDLIYDEKYTKTMIDVFGNDIMSKESIDGLNNVFELFKNQTELFSNANRSVIEKITNLYDNNEYSFAKSESTKLKKQLEDEARGFNKMLNDEFDKVTFNDVPDGFKYSINFGMLKEMLRAYSQVNVSLDMTKSIREFMSTSTDRANYVVDSLFNDGVLDELIEFRKYINDNPDASVELMSDNAKELISNFGFDKLINVPMLEDKVGMKNFKKELKDIMRNKFIKENFTPDARREIADSHLIGALEAIGLHPETMRDVATPIVELTKEQASSFKDVMRSAISPNFDDFMYNGKLVDKETGEIERVFAHNDFANHMKKISQYSEKLNFIPNIKAVNDAIIMKTNQARKNQILKDQNKFLMAWDKVTSLLKLNMTVVNPAFHMRNLYSNAFQTYLSLGASALDPKFQAQTLKALASKGRLGSNAVIDVVTADGRTTEIKWTDLLMHAKAQGVLGKDYFSEEAKSMMSGTKGLFSNDKVGNKFAKFDPTNTGNFIGYKIGGKIGSAFEDYSRLLHFAAAVKQGQSFSQAADTVNKFMFDYSDLTAFEQNALRRVIPFYTWMRKNTALQIDTLLNNPGRYQMYGKAINAIENSNDDDNGYVNKSILPRYFQNTVQTPFRVRKGYNGDYNPVFWNTAMPINDLNKLDVFNSKGLGQEAIGMLSPLIKAPLEQALNYNFFFEKPIVEGDDNPISTRAQHILSQLGSTNTIKGFTNKEGTDLGFNTLNFATGIKLSQINADYYKEQAGLITKGTPGRKSKQQKLLEYYKELYNSGEVNQYE